MSSISSTTSSPLQSMDLTGNEPIHRTRARTGKLPKHLAPGFSSETSSLLSAHTFSSTPPKKGQKRKVNGSIEEKENVSSNSSKKSKISVPECLTKWAEFAGSSELDGRGIYLITLVETGDLESIEIICKANPIEIDDCLKNQKKLLDKIKFGQLDTEVDSSKIDACCQYLIAKGADFSLTKVAHFLKNGCLNTAKDILIRAMLFPEKDLNVEIFLKTFSADKSLCTLQNLTQILKSVLLASMSIPLKDKEQFHKLQHSFISDLLRIGSRSGIALDFALLKNVISYKNDSILNGTIVEDTKSSLIDALLPHYFQEPTLGHLFLEQKHDLEFMEILLESDLAVKRFREFSQSLSKIFYVVIKELQSKILWMNDFIRLEYVGRKNSKQFDDKHSKEKENGEAEYKIRIFLTHILDSAVHLKIPAVLQNQHEATVLVTSVNHLLLFRKHLLMNNITQYDELLERVIEEKLFAFDLQHNFQKEGIGYPSMAQLIINRITALTPKQEQDPLIPEGFLPSCFSMLGGYEWKKKGHGVVYVVEKNSDQTFNFIIINTGEGSPILKTGKTYDITYSGLTLEELSESFFTLLLKCHFGKIPIKEMRELLEIIDKQLSKKGIKLSRGRIHSTNNGKLNCVVKSLLSYNKFRLLNPSDSLGLRFKAFYTDLLISDFKNLKKEIQTNHKKYSIFKELIGQPSKLRVWLDSIESYANKILAKRMDKAKAHVEAEKEGEVHESADSSSLYFPYDNE